MSSLTPGRGRQALGWFKGVFMGSHFPASGGLCIAKREAIKRRLSVEKLFTLSNREPD